MSLVLLICLTMAFPVVYLLWLWNNKSVLWHPAVLRPCGFIYEASRIKLHMQTFFLFLGFLVSLLLALTVTVLERERVAKVTVQLLVFLSLAFALAFVRPFVSKLHSASWSVACIVCLWGSALVIPDLTDSNLQSGAGYGVSVLYMLFAIAFLCLMALYGIVVAFNYCVSDGCCDLCCLIEDPKRSSKSNSRMVQLASNYLDMQPPDLSADHSAHSEFWDIIDDPATIKARADVPSTLSGTPASRSSTRVAATGGALASPRLMLLRPAIILAPGGRRLQVSDGRAVSPQSIQNYRDAWEHDWGTNSILPQVDAPSSAGGTRRRRKKGTINFVRDF